MVRDIDDLADDRARNIQTPGDQFYGDFLKDRPKPEWPPYIDESAQDLSAKIQIADTNLTAENFGPELGEFYRRGLIRSTGEYADLPEILQNTLPDDTLGAFAYKINELNYELSQTEAGLENIQEAVEAVVAKILTRHTGKDLNPSFEISGGSVSEIAVQLFRDQTIANNIDVLTETLTGRAGDGLLSLLDEPQMMTPLWEHQREALAAWQEQGFRGYVDMATATGKTVLGLSALALRYGRLYQTDQTKLQAQSKRDSDGREDVLIVAHNDLILEQWRREFDRHLNIPQERTQDGDDISLSWGEIHFRTPQKLVNEDRINYDLVLLDEAHHYALSSEWGGLLDEFSNDVLALSGSVDDAGTDSQNIQARLSNSIGDEVMRYTIKEAKRDGIIPSFDWEVRYTRYGGNTGDLEQLSQRCEEAFHSFQNRLSNDELNLNTSRRLETYEDIRNFSHTTTGKDLKQSDEAFRDLVTRLFSRRTKRWNLSPTLDSVVDIVVEKATTEKVVVLADSNAQVEELETRLQNLISDSGSINIVSKSDSKEDQLTIIDEFDRSEGGGVLLGTGDLLGEGVDIQHASVAINMATGGVNPELVQRIGRVLRNPADDPKHAMFYNIVGLPPTPDASVPREDGKRIIEEAAGFCSLGSRFDKLPGFSASSQVNKSFLEKLLVEGSSFISQLEGEHSYEFGDTERDLEYVTSLRTLVENTEGDVETILGKWEEYSLEHSKDDQSSKEEAVSQQSPDLMPETDRERYIREIERIGDNTKGVLTPTIVNAEIDDSVERLIEDFGTWKAVLDAAGIDNKQRLLDELNRVAEQIGHPPSRSEVKEFGRVEPSIFEEYFETYTAAFKQAFDQDTLRQQYIDDIQEVSESSDQIPRSSTVDGEIDYPVQHIIREFGSWEAALDAAEIDYQRRLKDELRRIADEVGHQPSTTEVNKYGNVSAATFGKYFDSFSAAREAALGSTDGDGTEPASSKQETLTPGPNEPEDSSGDSRGPSEQAQDKRDQSEHSLGGTEEGTTVDSPFWDTTADPLQETESVVNGDTNGESNDSRDKLDRKIDEWKSQLLDLSRRNKLISFKTTKTKSLPFDATNPTATARTLYNEEELFIHKSSEDDDSESPTLEDLESQELLSSRSPDETENSLYNVGLNQKKHLRERGVDTLYLALGMLHWYSVDYSDKELRSPLFLMPVELEEKTLRNSDRHNYVLHPKAEGLRFNPALRKKLGSERGVEFPQDESLSLDRIDAAFETVHESIYGFDRWSIGNEVVLGIFDFVKFSIYNDLEENRDRIKEHPIVQALVGNTEPLLSKEGDIDSPFAEELDDVVDPVDMYQVLDADSSQQEAIEAAKRGKSFVLQGPPGTGKSQTISNIIAEKLAQGDSVLFVSEKQAALNVVKDRLDAVGVGRFCLEAHGRKANNTEVLGTLENEIRRSRVKPSNQRQQRLEKLRKRRQQINEYGSKLFHSPDGWNITVYQAFGYLTANDEAPRIDVGIEAPLDTGQEKFETAVEELETLAKFEDEIREGKSSPWRHTTLRSWGVDTGEKISKSLNAQRQAIDELVSISELIEKEVGFYPSSLGEITEAADFLGHLQDRPKIVWQEALFEDTFLQEDGRFSKFAELEREYNTMRDELAEKYERSFFSLDAAELHGELASYGFFKFLRPSYRSLKRRILTHARDDYSPDYSELVEDLRKLTEVRRLEETRQEYQDVKQQLGTLYKGEDTDWDQLEAAQGWVKEFLEYPREWRVPVQQDLVENTVEEIDPIVEKTSSAIQNYKSAAEFFEEAMEVDRIRIEAAPFKDASYSSVRTFLGKLDSQVSGLQSRVRYLNQLDSVHDTIAEDFIDTFLEKEHQPDDLVPAFTKNFYTDWLNAVYEKTDLDSFSVDTMEKYLDEFRVLDQEQQELAQIEIQHQVTSRRPSLDLEYASSSEQVMVRREIEKERRHKPLRELFAEASSYITDLTPCFMMSPLSVAQYLKTDSISFDTVIFDEASQIMPEDAISSLIRADQAVIAGDTKQLPPTSFFEADVETTEDVREDLESILEETASVMPEKYLQWHYRSRTDELIEFSNHQYYDNSLRTFPENDPDVETGVRFEYVPEGVYDRGGSRQNEIEAAKVIDLVEDHAANHGEKSLGVVAFSTAQEEAIREELQERRETNPVLDSFVNQDDVLDEFFIKSLEMVQGDERDRMIFSVGYGYDAAGKMSMNFGPLNRDGGERRLNVAITRARELVTVVSSIEPEDIDLTSTDSTGVKHFKQYLEYARDGPEVLVRDVDVTGTLDFDSQFEEAVYDELTARGFGVATQIESSGYSIDLGIKNPEKPGKFILGIECDGAAYHSSKTARDRDRIRQSVLEDLGWTIHRIWSPDWVSNKEKELSKIENRVDKLLEDATSNGGMIADSEAIQSYEAETFDEDESKTAHSEIIEYSSPQLSRSRDRDFDEIRNSTIRSNLLDLVDEYGPLKSDVAYRVLIERWHITRLGKNIRRTLNGHATSLHQKGKLFRHNGFLWPSRENLNFKVRIHNGTESRDVDEIPVEELAKAAAIILKEGGSMTTDDLALETAKLFGYQRRGTRIQERIAKGVDLLEESDLLTGGEKVRLTKPNQIDSEILENIY